MELRKVRTGTNQIDDSRSADILNQYFRPDYSQLSGKVRERVQKVERVSLEIRQEELRRFVLPSFGTLKLSVSCSASKVVSKLAVET